MTLLSCFLALLLPFVAPVQWRAQVSQEPSGGYELVITGNIAPDHYLHPVADGGVSLALTPGGPAILMAEPLEFFTPADYKGDTVATGTYVLRQPIALSGAGTVKVEGILTWRVCYGDDCNSPEDFLFSVPVQVALPTAGASAAAGSLWKLLLEAILWGFLMLLTPCVFPMVPMTVSFFLKQSGSPARGRVNALAYGIFIVLLYTLPICLIIGLTWAAGGAAVTADIFNWLSTHWLPNLIFFVVFMVFAASFFGFFELTLPASWTTKADAGSTRSGLGGVFFLALTLVLVSFSCTGPIVGTVLIKSTQGEFWVPMITMLAFSIAFALPFALLAFFPSLLKGLPRSGGWLNTVKVVLGFVEIALGLKFLSVADQTYHWGILPRDIYLVIWIICFSLLALYLLGVIRFKYDAPLQRLSPVRLGVAVLDVAFIIYLATGLWGAPLKALSGYLPPMPATAVVEETAQARIALPQGLVGYTDLEEGLSAASASGKKVFVDITGHGCVNCREMEARVWSDPAVRQLLADDFVIVSLYVDDKARLPEEKWVKTESGRVLKDVGRVNSLLVRERFGVNSQPNYFILSPDGTVLRGPRGYNLDIPAFVDFLSF